MEIGEPGFPTLFVLMSEKKSEPKREGTMQATVKDDDKPEMKDQGDTKDSDGKNLDEPSIKKARLSKDNTMLETTKIAKDILGNEKLDESRSSTRAFRESKASTKRLSTMAKTAKEGEALLKELGHKDDNPDSERRRTRSQTRGAPPPPPLQKSSAKDTPKRGRRGRPRKDEGSASEEEVRSKEVNNTEEKEEMPNYDGPIESEAGTEMEEVQN